jgi:hypothetical protein
MWTTDREFQWHLVPHNPHPLLLQHPTKILSYI